MDIRFFIELLEVYIGKCLQIFLPYSKLIGKKDILLVFFNDTATTEIYTLSLHDALPICFRPCPYHSALAERRAGHLPFAARIHDLVCKGKMSDRKSTRLNSSHQIIS